MHCSQHGTCVEGKCICDQDYTGIDCSVRLCKNNCSNYLNETTGEWEINGVCVDEFPQKLCSCDWRKKRAGDDCSLLYCLNECSNHGICVQGECECYDNYSGLDCSVFTDFMVQTAILGV